MIGRDIIIHRLRAVLGHLGELDAFRLGMRGSSRVLYATATRKDCEEESFPDLAQPLESSSSVQLFAFVDEGGPMEEGAERLQNRVVVLQEIVYHLLGRQRRRRIGALDLYGRLAVRMRRLEDTLAELAKVCSNPIKTVHGNWASISLLARSELGWTRNTGRWRRCRCTSSCAALIAEHVA